jgi:hypothetical protein
MNEQQTEWHTATSIVSVRMAAGSHGSQRHFTTTSWRLLSKVVAVRDQRRGKIERATAASLVGTRLRPRRQRPVKVTEGHSGLAGWQIIHERYVA